MSGSVVVVVVFIGEARKAKASPGSRAYGHAPLGEFSAPGTIPRLILRPRATFKYWAPIKLTGDLRDGSLTP